MTDPLNGARWRILQGECLPLMRDLADASIDAVVTDPPYGLSEHSPAEVLACLSAWCRGEEYQPTGRGFMGKAWDAWVPGPAYWREALRVLKPGGHLLAFAGSRTQDLMGMSLRLAGFEIRDCIMWVFGSGFPKSLDISKAIDAAAGAEREVVGSKMGLPGYSLTDGKGGLYGGGFGANGTGDGECRITAPATPEAEKWAGWGTALKPAYETVLVCEKPHDLRSLCAILARKVGSEICRLPSLAKAAGLGSGSSQPDSSAAPSAFAQWDAVARCNTLADLFGLMDMLRCDAATPTSLSTGLSWLNILAGLSGAASTFTTEMASSLTTDLRILNCSPSPITAESMLHAETSQHGTGSSASLAVSIFSAAAAKLAYTLTTSAPGSATSPAAGLGLRPDAEPIILARKPLGSTVAACVLEHGTGGLNIDGCRIDAEVRPDIRNAGWPAARVFGDRLGGGVQVGLTTSGRWPANLAHDGSPEVLALFPETGPSSDRPRNNGAFQSQSKGAELPHVSGGHADQGGSAARFYYCSKASKEDRDEGLTSMPVATAGERSNRTEGSAGITPYAGTSSPGRNIHPTVKPTDLMRWLVRLVTPPGGIVLDPFCGSGSTGKAAMLEGFRFIGIEREEASAETARLRVAHAEATPVQLDIFAPAAPRVAPPVDDRQPSFDL